MNLQDVLRPISGFFFIQPFVIIWYLLFMENPAEEYLTSGWTFQIYMTLLFIPYYWWYEKLWNEQKIPESVN